MSERNCYKNENQKTINGQSRTISLAIQRDDNWIVLRQAVKEIKKNHLLAFCDDLIYFLQYRETHMDEIDEIILSASSKSFVRSDMTEVMVFKPILYRDFMLSERHVINNGRGMVKNCMPSAYPILKAYEFITRHTFPPIKRKRHIMRIRSIIREIICPLLGAEAKLVILTTQRYWIMNLNLA